MPSKAVEPVSVSLTPAGSIPPNAIAEAMRSGTKIRLDLDKADISAAMLAQKLNATTVDELDSSGELDDMETVYGKPVRVMGVGFRNSDDQYVKSEGSLGVYVVLNLVDSSGAMSTVGTGALDVVVTANKLVELDALGKDWWVIDRAKETASGYRPLNMRRGHVDADGSPF